MNIQQITDQREKGSTLGECIVAKSNLVAIVPLWSDRTLLLGWSEEVFYQMQFIRRGELTQMPGNKWELTSKCATLNELVKECLAKCFPLDSLVVLNGTQE